jgi:hypothetical protein
VIASPVIVIHDESEGFILLQGLMQLLYIGLARIDSIVAFKTLVVEFPFTKSLPSSIFWEIGINKRKNNSFLVLHSTTPFVHVTLLELCMTRIGTLFKYRRPNRKIKFHQKLALCTLNLIDHNGAVRSLACILIILVHKVCMHLLDIHICPQISPNDKDVLCIIVLVGRVFFPLIRHGITIATETEMEVINLPNCGHFTLQQVLNQESQSFQEMANSFSFPEIDLQMG